MANNNNIDMETLLPVALIGGAGLLIWATSRKGGTAPPPGPTGYCVPQQTVIQLTTLPGTHPANWHPTAICRYYAAMSSQQQVFLSLDSATQDALMSMTPEQAVWFTRWACG